MRLPIRLAAIVLASLVLASACGPRAPSSRTPPHPAAPPSRVQHLADLFERARLVGDAAARRELGEALALGGEPRGEAATRSVLERLANMAETAGEPDLAVLLDADLEELEGEGDPRSTAAERRRVALRGGAAAGTALLDLYASCARSLYDATQLPASQRARVANHCLYALTTRDPAPYIDRGDADGDGTERPPDPPWRLYFRGLEALLARLATAAPRLAGLGRELARRQAELEEVLAQDGLEPPEPGRIAASLVAGDETLPRLERAPWLLVDGDLVGFGKARYTLRDHEMVRRFERLVGGDPVRRLVLFVTGPSTADAVDVLGALARRNLVGTLELALRGPTPEAAPRPLAADALWMEELRASLSQLAPPPAETVVLLPLELEGGRGRDRPRTVVAEALPATLVVYPEGLLLRASDGELGFSAADLEARLGEMGAAFPDADGLRFAVAPTARYADVVRTALAARRRFRWLLFTEVPRLPRRQGFVERLRSRAGARVSLRDAAGQPLAGAEWLRGCYLAALDEHPALALRATLPGAAEVKDERLRACLIERARGIPTLGPGPVTVELAPR